MSDLTNFIKYELLPRVFSSANSIFPSMELQQYQGGWRSSHKLDGSPSQPHRKDKSVITAKRPTRILEQGGGSINLLDFYLTSRGLGTDLKVEANYNGFCDLCRAVGIEPPTNGDSEKWRAYKEQQDTLERAVAEMRKALYSPEGAAVLAALKGTDYPSGQRGFDDDFISFAEIGYCSPAVVQLLTPVVGEEWGFKKYAAASRQGEAYFVLPYRSGGRILGFTFRGIHQHDYYQATDFSKVINSFVSKSATKAADLFGLRGFKLTGNKESDYKALLVEGEIDALRAEYAGCGNVLSIGGKHPSIEALAKVKAMGIKAVTILLDTDPKDYTEQGRKEKDAEITKAIDTALSVGMEVYVANLNVDGREGQKMDVDSYLREWSGEELKQFIAETTQRASLWEFERIIKSFGSATINAPEFGEFRRQVVNLCARYKSATDREIIYKAFEQSTGNQLSEMVISEEAEQIIKEQRKAAQAVQARNIAEQITKLTAEGKTAEAIEMGAQLTRLSEMSDEDRYRDLLRPLTLDEIIQSYKEKPKGLHTGYYLDARVKQGQAVTLKPTEEAEIILPSSALTFVGAPTSHGKTTFLQNLALSVVQNGEDGAVLFFTYEETTEDVVTEFLTLYLGEQAEGFSANPTRTIRSYFRDGTTKMFRGDEHAKEEAVRRLQAAKNGFGQLLSTGQLRVYYRIPEIGELVDIIRHHHRKLNVKAVFVDYVQLLREKGSRGQRKEELQIICEKLRGVAVETKLPIILGAQMNREAPSPVEMSNQDIADASDIEHAANTILLLWNSSYKPHHSKSRDHYNKDGEPCSDIAKSLQARGLTLGEGGKLYVLLSKNRGGERGLDGVFDFKQNIREIKSSAPYKAGGDTTQTTGMAAEDNTTSPFGNDNDKLPF